MAKQLNVNLAFTADTGKAKAQLQELQNQLSKVINMPGTAVAGGITEGIQKATRAAAELKVHLQNATNIKTGSLDFAKLNQSIKNSGSSLSEYAAKIQSIGPEGQKAFAMLAQSVASAEVPIRRSNALLSELWVTMKNTARWQLTSSMLHGFMGAVQSAVGYTEDLNESLNNIRIVTGNSVEQMADFAKEANKAAKALSTSTTDYTNAALIYYQQGLDQQQVLERADITIKMANVSRQSAEEVSDQMTAIWNNFYDGSQSLEHYADAMTRLGADTASSSDEIAQGLEKFAAIGDMIGLSFDNAAAALATVTATTRQSADVVGTAFKTIFARIQGLSLGETLEDGTNLNKYSEALNKVGISIFEQNGELKDMDNILTEMGAKWKTMSKDQQVALAQTVAGVRQYNQLVALMDNYDFYEQNLFSAQTADGTLQTQADIYAESWEAASERVDAALEGLYDSLINDEAFIDLLNGIEKVISGVEKMVDSMGGFGGVITSLGVIFTNVFRKQIAQSITDASYSLMSWTEKGRQKIREEKSDEIDKILAVQGKAKDGSVQDVRNQVIKAQLLNQQELINSAKNLSDVEQQTLQILLDQQKARGELAIKAAEQAEAAKKAEAKARGKLYTGEGAFGEDDTSDLDAVYTAARDLGIAQAELKKNDFDIGKLSEYQAKGNIEAVDAIKKVISASSKLNQVQKNALDGHEQQGKALRDYSDRVIETAEAEAERNMALIDAKREVELSSVKEQENTSRVQANTQAKNRNAQTTEEATEREEDFNQEVQETGQQLDEVNDKLEENEQKKKKLNSTQVAQNFVAGANAAMSAASAVQSFSSAIDTLNSDAEPLEKLTSIFMSLSMGGSMAANSLTSLNKITLTGGKTLGQAAANTKLATAVLGKFGVVTETAGAAATSTGASLAALGGYALIAVAAIIALVEAIKFGIDVYNEDANAAKSAAEAAQNLSDKAKEAQSSVDDLLSTFDSYDSAVDKLNECTKGTDEWNEALTNVNDQMWEILDKYPELAKMDNIFKDGLLNHDVLDDYIAQQKKAAENARAAALTASARSSKAKVKADETALKREINLTVSQNTYYDDQGTIALQNQVHAQKMFADLYEKASDKNFNTEEFNAAVNEYIEGFSMTSEGFEDEIRDTADKIRDLGKASIQASTQMENAAKLLANQILGEDATEDQVNDFATKYAEAEELLYNEVIAETRNGINKLSGKNDAEVKALWERYQKATGTNYSLSSNAVQGTDYNRSFEYINEEGIKVVISAEELAAAIAASEAQSETQEDFRDNLFDANSGALGFFGSDVIKDGVDTSLLNSLAETMDLEDAETVAALQTILNDKQTAAEQIAEINKLLGSMTEEEKAQAEIDSLTKNAVDNYELDADDIEDQAKRLQEAYQLTSVEATKLAIENQRMNKGVETLSENWEDWQKVLKKGSLNKEEKLTLDYTNTIQDLTKAVADLTGASEDLELPDEFFESEENLKLIEEAAQGSEQAINELGVAVGYASVQLMDLKAVTDENGSILNQADIDAFNTNKEIVLAGITELQAKVAEGTDLVGQGLDAILNGGAEGASSWVTSLNEMAMATNMTVEEMNALLGQLGLEADVTTTDIEQDVQVPVYKVQMSNVETDPETGFTSYTTRSIPMGTETHKGKISVAQIGVNGVDPGTPDVKYIGNGPVSSSSVKSSKSGGGGSKGSKPKKVNKSDIVDRYKEINDQLDNVKDAYEDASKEADRLYGASRISAMKRANNEIQKEIGLLEKKKEEAQKYLKLDKEALELAAKQAGVQLEFQDNEIVNYTAVLEQLYNQLKALIDAAGETVDEAEQEAIDKLQEKIDELKSAIKTFDDTKESIENTDNDIKDKFYEWQDNNYEELSHKLELEIDINDAELQKLEYFLDKYSDNFYKMAESAALMNDKINPTIQNLEDYKSHKEALDESYRNGKISREAYIEGLKEVREGYYNNLEALIELDKAMMYYYGDTLDAASEELSTFTDHMGHLTSVFDHYMSLMEILGKQKDYDAMGNFLGGKAGTIRDRLDVAKEYYEMLKENSKADEYWANYQAALSSGDEDMAKWWKEQWDAEIDALDAAQAEMLGLTEEWAEAMKAVIENNMNKIAETLEKTLTGGTTFDTMMDEFDKLNTRQEEYLTKTNQIYETNKLMRTANKALDETDNKVAKQKLKNFIDETKSLQENTQLSKYELEIQQAKYDLLLAEIALEEAQNAKSTVRLSRDNEGNFGYIYTADQDAIDNAQQGVEDADNRLYNLSLEGQQEYTEKYLQAQQEMYNELIALQQAWLNGEIASEEEYQRQKDNILNHYLGEGGVLQTYSNLYRIACQTDADAVADNWQTNYGDMTQDTETWKVVVNQYLEDIKVQTDAWKDVSTQANADVEGALEDSEGATKDLKDESSRLADTITNKVIPAIDKELEKVAAQTAAYAAQRKELLALIEQYEAYIESLNKQVEVQSVGFDKDTDYSALMNEYLSKDGSTKDVTYQELLKQREAKIDWLETQGYDSSYWGTRGDETTAMYNRILGGGGTDEENTWFNADYVKDEELVGIFEKLGVPIEEIQAKLDALKEATDGTNTKIDESKKDIVSTVKESGEATNTKVDEVKEQINAANKTNAETTDQTITTTGETSDEVVKTTGETTDSTIETGVENTIDTLQEVANVIVTESGNIQDAINNASSIVASSVGGAISSIRSEISSLRSTVNGMAIGSIAGPVGTAVGGLIGSVISRFDSGGYTGDWGPAGKLAVLDEKELVLNKSDTDNILQAVSIIREISDMIDIQANAASLFTSLSSPNIATSNEVLEQMVTIHAEFPNATNHSEIEEAFNNLVNRASQYANRK